MASFQIDQPQTLPDHELRPPGFDQAHQRLPYQPSPWVQKLNQHANDVSEAVPPAIKIMDSVEMLLVRVVVLAGAIAYFISLFFHHH